VGAARQRPAGVARALAVAVLAAVAQTASADTYVQQTVRTEPYKMMLSEVPARADTVRVWLGKDRAALSSQGTNAILRVDQSCLYILNRASRTYTVAPYPCDLLGLYPPDSPGQIAMRDAMQALKPRVEVAPTAETRVIRGYPCKLFRITMSAARTSVVSETWATTQAPVDIKLFRALMTAILSVMPTTASLAKSLEEIDGITVLDEQRISSPGREMLSIRELSEIRQADAPRGVYEVPGGWREIPFDPAQLRQ
jgi:hypothetical protein